MTRERAIALALPLLREFEQGPGGGPALKPYRCPAGKLTIGYGHTGDDVFDGMFITVARAEELLLQDARRFSESVSRVCPQTTDSQHAALLCFAFNVRNWPSGTVDDLHNAGKYAEAAARLLQWNKARNSEGKLVPLRGLTRRRAAEAKLYLSDDGREDHQRTRAADLRENAPLVGKTAGVTTATAGAAVAASEVASQLAETQGMLEPLAPYSDSLRVVFLCVAVAAIIATCVFRYFDRRAGRA